MKQKFTGISKLMQFICLVLFFLIARPTYSQTYIPVAVSGFDADGIAEIPTNSITCTSAAMDNSGLVLYSAAFAAGAGITGGIVNSGTIVSGTRTYQLMPFNVPNVLFDTNGTMKVMTINTPAQFARISLLCFSTEMASTVSIVLTFTDGSFINGGSFNIQDWYNGAGAVYSGFGRCPRAANVTTNLGPPTNPMMYPIDINLPCAYQTKLLSTITFINTGGAFAYTKACFFALSAVPYVFTDAPTIVNDSCFGTATGRVTLNVSNNSAPLSYLWNTAPVQTTNPATNLAPGTYDVTVTDAMGCTAAFAATITQPNVLTASVPTVTNVTACSNNNGSVIASTTGGTGPMTYVWNTVPTQTTDTAINLTVGTYTVTCIDAHGCSATASATVLQPTIMTVTSSPNTTICGGEIVNINLIAGGGTTPYTYAWNPGTATSSTIVVAPTTTTTYNATVTDASGCTIMPAPITITVKNAPNISFTSDLLTSCVPMTVHFTDHSTVAGGDSVTSWSWDFGDSNGSNSKNPTNIYYTPGIYSVKLVATSSNGCSATEIVANMITVYQAPFAEFSATTYHTTITAPEIQFFDQSINASTWTWFFGDNQNNAFGNSKNPIHTYTAPGVYMVTLLIQNSIGCIDTVSKNVIVDADVEFYIPSAFSPNGDGLNETFTPTGYNINVFHMYIYDRWGVNIFTTNDITNGWNGELYGSVAQTGVYGYRIDIVDGYGDAHQYTGKLVLMR